MTASDKIRANGGPVGLEAGLRGAFSRLNAGHGLAAFCAAYIASAFLLSPADYVAMANIYIAWLPTFNTILFLFGILPAALFLAPKQPVDFIARLLRAQGSTIALVIILFVLTLAAFTTYKLHIPRLVSFHADVMLADIDDLLHGGAPWRYLHALDSNWVSGLVDVAYSRLWFLEWLAVVTFAAFAARKPETLRYLWAMALTTVIAGTALATLFSSVGPIFYENFVGEPRFAGLMANLREHPANESLFYHSDYLLRNYLDGETQLGTGISAMPSMHVAIVILNALYLGRLNRWLGAIGWLFALLIVFGSVYTGWHYAVDGYVAMIVVGVIWLSTGRLLNRRAGT